jgi:gamma-glutamyl-gamma-aminobutyrate hydrolase PuuD
VIAVQWHAECLLEHAPQAALFKSFVAACARYEQGGDAKQPLLRAA